MAVLATFLLKCHIWHLARYLAMDLAGSGWIWLDLARSG